MISSLEALVPWFSTGFLRRMARDSLSNTKDQWCDLSIIEFTVVKDKLCYVLYI